MARTKASVVGKVFSGKSSAKVSKSQPSKAPSSKAGSSGPWFGTGGNPYFPRETPGWQKPITNFFGGLPVKPDADGQVPTSSKSDVPKRKRKTMAISSDTESDCEETKPDQAADLNETDANVNISLNDTNVSDRLDDSDVHLLPLTEDGSSHKIAEYFNVDNSARNIATKKDEPDSKNNNIDVVNDTSFDKIDDCNTESDEVIKVKLGMFKNKGKGKGKGKGKKSSNSAESKTVENGKTDSENIDESNGNKTAVNGNMKATEKENLKPSNVNENTKSMNANKVDVGKKHELDEVVGENLPKRVKIDA